MAKFLEEGHKVKITIMFRGREVFHPELGKKILDRIAEQMDGMGKSESVPRLDGRNMVMVLAPDKRAKQSAASEGPGPQRQRRRDAGSTGGEATDGGPAGDGGQHEAPATAGRRRRHRRSRAAAETPVATEPAAAEQAGGPSPAARVERRRGMTRCRR